MTDTRRGLLLGVSAYLLWGAFPLYWPLLQPAGAVEILGHRVIWSCLVMTVLLVALRRRSQLRAIWVDRRVRLLLTLAAAVVSVNWTVYIWAVNHDKVVESSLGYFINPLVTVLFGVFIFAERLRPMQWAAMALGGVAVAVLAFEYGALPWVALVLAFTFGTYGLLKKSANAGAVESLAFETILLSPLAAAFLVVLVTNGASTFATHGTGHALLLASTGIATAVPLLCFGAAATRISMVALGLLQYLGPLIQFALGVFWLGEEMSTGRWVGFCLVWLAVGLFTVEGIHNHRRQLRDAAEAAAV